MENLFTTNELLISTFDGTNTKVAWAIQCLVDNCEDFNVFRENRKISEVSNKNISNLKGFTSRILLVTIVFEGGNGVPFKCVMKLPGQSIVIEEENGEDVKDEVVAAERNLYMLVHNREAMFLNKYQDIKGLRIPKCYGVKDWINKKQEGAILMNYLGDTHAHVGYFENLNVEQTQSVLDQIFILQKHFLLKRDEDWKPHFTPIVKASDYGVWIKAFEPNFTLMKSFVDESLYKDTEKEILALSSNYVEMLDYLLTVLPFEEGNQSVFTHSDSWINNFLFTKNGEGKPSNDVTLLDFQICYNGGIGNDLSNTLINSTTPEIRKQLEKTLPDYYQKLKNETGDKLRICYETFKKNYDLSSISHACLFTMCVGVNLKVNGAKDGCADWDIKKKDAAFKSITALNDAVYAARVLKPEWLIKRSSN